MSREQRRVASFCRLCLAKTKNQVPIFGKEEENVINLLMLIELDIDPDLEPDAAVCYKCIVTLEGFFQFKEQCHENDEYLKTHPPEDSAEVSEASEYEGGESSVSETITSASETITSDEAGPVGETIEIPHEEPPTPKRKLTVPAAKPNFKRQKISYVYQPNQNVSFEQTTRHDTPPDLDLAAIERECEIFNVPRRTDKGPSLDEMQVLQDSYPDYFYFEKGVRTHYFTLVYYGERYNSASFSERYTYWKCVHRRKYDCKALLVAWNSYLEFERRHEHSHGEVEMDPGPVVEYTPRQALPEVFKICRTINIKHHARRRQALLLKKKFELEMAGCSRDENVAAEEVVVQEYNDGMADALTKVMHNSGILDDNSDQYHQYSIDLL